MSLSTLSLDVVDPSIPETGALSTPAQILYPALDPRSAADLSHYSLLNVTTGVTYNQFISGASFVPTD